MDGRGSTSKSVGCRFESCRGAQTPRSAPGKVWTDPELVLRWICTRHRRQLTGLHAAGLADQVRWQRSGLATGPAPAREATP
jgi:hypothetical protein